MRQHLPDPDWTDGDDSDLAGLIVVVILIAIIVVLCCTFRVISDGRENRAFRRGYVAAVDSVRARAHGSMRDTTQAFRLGGPPLVRVAWESDSTAVYVRVQRDANGADSVFWWPTHHVVVGR